MLNCVNERYLRVAFHRSTGVHIPEMSTVQNRCFCSLKSVHGMTLLEWRRRTRHLGSTQTSAEEGLKR